jgi:hypothetical protein
LFVTLFGMPDTKGAGDIAEAIVLAEFAKAGFPVLVPWGDNQRYDMVVEAGGSFLRVQCKTASPCGWKGDGACLRFKARSGVHESHPYRGQADLFAAFSPDTGQVYVLAVDEVPETDVWLRLTPARNGQHSGIRWAKDYLLETWAARQAATVRLPSATPRESSAGVVCG